MNTSIIRIINSIWFAHNITNTNSIEHFIGYPRMNLHTIRAFVYMSNMHRHRHCISLTVKSGGRAQSSTSPTCDADSV